MTGKLIPEFAPENKEIGKVVMVSGGFDPIHVGHLEMLEEAKELGNRLVAVVNCDAWLIRKKGRFLMNQEDRAKLIKSIRYVDDVFILESERDDVSEAIEIIRPDIFANGGDRDKRNATDPKSSLYWDIKTCKKLGINMIFNVGKNGKIRSSSELLEKYAKKRV